MITDLFSRFDNQNFNRVPYRFIIIIDFIALSIFLSSFYFHINTVRGGGVILILQKLILNLIFLSKGKRLGGFTLVLSSLFIFILFNNITGLIPYGFRWVSHVALSFRAAGPLWFSILVSGFGWHSGIVLANCYPLGARLSLIRILVLGETISLFLRPFSLALRLAVNITAGHVFMGLISKGVIIVIVNKVRGILFIFCGVVLLGLFIAECVVCLIQAFVFVMLLTLYSNEHPRNPLLDCKWEILFKKIFYS